MVYRNKCLREWSDIPRLIEDGYIGICMLAENQLDRGPKAPTDTFQRKDWLSVEKIEESPSRNMGVCYDPKTEGKFKQDKFLCCVDVDGIKSDNLFHGVEPNDDMVFGVRVFLKNILVESLWRRGIHPIIVKTQSDGFHVYFWCTSFHGFKHGFENYQFPGVGDFKVSQREEFERFPGLVDILGKQCPNGMYELFSRVGMTVAPGSVIEGKQYMLTEDSVGSIYDCNVYDGVFEDLLFEIIEENFFHYDPISSSSITPISGGSGVDLSPVNISSIGDLVIETWGLLDGEKHAATLALGGFLFSRGVSEDSIRRIGDYVLDNKGDRLSFNGSDTFERSGGFMRALLHDSRECVEKEKQGLTSLSDRLKGKFNIQRFQKVLWLNSAPCYHKFYPNGRDADVFPEVVLDFKGKVTHFDPIRRKRVNVELINGVEAGTGGDGNTNDEKSNTDGDTGIDNNTNEKNSNTDKQEKEEFCFVKQQGGETLYSVVSGITYIDDISTPTFLPKMEQPVKITLETDIYGCEEIVERNTEVLFRNYYRYTGVHSSKGKRILEYVFNEYEHLGIIPTVEGSSRAGIYLSKDKKIVHRYIDTDNGVTERPAFQVDPDDLENALQLLTDINSAVGWGGDKFATSVKIALLQPYSFIFKQYQQWVPGIIFYGEAGTLKSTIGSMLCQISTPINVNNHHYITNGSEINSEYRMGRSFDYNSYPLVIDECIDVFGTKRNTEALKNIISQQLLRSPGGENPQTYYARGVPIITLNDRVDAMDEREFARRFAIINLTTQDAYSAVEIEEHMSFVNKDGILNKRFEELLVIGDFIFNYMCEHMEMFTYNIYKVMDLLVEALDSATGVDLSWLNVDVSESIDFEISESEDNDLNNGLKALRRIFYENKRPFHQGSEESLLRDMIGREYDYIHLTNNGDVVITKGFEDEFNKTRTKSLKLLEFARLLNKNYNENIQYDCAQRIDIQGSTKIKRKQKRGVKVDWNTFVEIMNVKREDDNKVIVEEIING